MSTKCGFYILFYFLLTSAGIGAQSRVQELQATQHKQSIIINYLISKGNSCTGYQIQRSNDTLNFTTIYSYSGICGELTKAQFVTFTDEFPEKNAVNYYRVQIPPADQSKVISVTYSDISENGYVIYENPVGEFLKLATLTKSKLKIYTQTGSLIGEGLSNENGSFNEDVSKLDTGLYYFSIEPAMGQSIFGKFIKK